MTADSTVDPVKHALQIRAEFAKDLVDWQKSDGRNHLPWQNTRDPYRVWLSEIMLQQTQVVTVLDYYRRFLDRYPDVGALAAASEDDVFGLWSGLGYYSRARNLHACAKAVVANHGGSFPKTAVELQTLPGIGPSTAAAIASFCFAERVAIMDGNVKRVLTRVLGFDGDLAEAREVKQLWTLATSLLPENDGAVVEDMPRYTQGMMDLGATLCTRRKPQCVRCPVQRLCRAFAAGEPEKYPVKSRKLLRSTQSLALLWARRPDGSIWLERRPATGIWGGLYCLPMFDDEDALLSWLPSHLRQDAFAMATLSHALTHKDLYLKPVVVDYSDLDHMAAPSTTNAAVHEPDRVGGWFNVQAWTALGLPAPIRKLLLSGGAGQRELSFKS